MLEKQFLKSDRLDLANTQIKLNDVIYKYNNFGFRCDDFDSWENYPIRILFAGCGITEGVGIPLDKSWANIFHSMLCKEVGKIPFWNIAYKGASLDHLVKHLYIEGEILQPHIVISLLPKFEYRERWNNDYWDSKINKNREDYNSTRTFLKKNYIQYQTEKNLSFINLLMNRWNCKFLYINQNEDFNMSNIVFPNFKRFDNHIKLINNIFETNKIFAENLFKDMYPYLRKNK